MPSPGNDKELARAVWRSHSQDARSPMAWLAHRWNRLVAPHPAALGREPLSRDMVERWRLRNSAFLLLLCLATISLAVFAALGSPLIVLANAVLMASYGLGFFLSCRRHRQAACLLVVAVATAVLTVTVFSIGPGIGEIAYCVPLTLAFLLLEPSDRKARVGAVVLTMAGAIISAGAGVDPWFPPAPGEAVVFRMAVVGLSLSSAAVGLWMFIGNRLRTVDSLEHALADARADRTATKARVVGLDHELRTPLQDILGMLSVLERTELTSEQRDFIRTAQASGDALVKVLRDIAAVAREPSDKIATEAMFGQSPSPSSQPPLAGRAVPDSRPLPEAGSQPSERRSVSASGSDAGPLSARVLVVEDNAINQKVAARMLEGLGCEVQIAEHGQEALDLLTGAGPGYDLVFMDIQMPVMDGIAATRAIREHEAATGSRTPIVAMTAHAMEADRQRCLEAGMDGYITKPIKPAELREILRRHVPVLAAPTQGASSPPAR